MVGTSILLDVFKGYRSAYQELRNVSLSGNLAYVLYEWSLMDEVVKVNFASMTSVPLALFYLWVSEK